MLSIRFFFFLRDWQWFLFNRVKYNNIYYTNIQQVLRVLCNILFFFFFQTLPNSFIPHINTTQDGRKFIFLFLFLFFLFFVCWLQIIILTNNYNHLYQLPLDQCNYTVLNITRVEKSLETKKPRNSHEGKYSFDYSLLLKFVLSYNIIINRLYLW